MSRLDHQINQAIELLQHARHAVALTGAGISTPSGIPDFRSPSSGLWERHEPMLVATIYAFRRRPQDFYEWMHPLAGLIMAARPNAAHVALAELEAHGPLRAVITQNIDMLHHVAGSQNVYEVHGHLRQATCIACFDEVDAEELLTTFVETAEVPRCSKCGGVMKPNVTLFGELPPIHTLKNAERAALACDLMLVAGTSLEVLPVGELPELAKQTGAELIIVNQSETHVDEMADVVIRGDVCDILPRLAAPFRAQAAGA